MNLFRCLAGSVLSGAWPAVGGGLHWRRRAQCTLALCIYARCGGHGHGVGRTVGPLSCFVVVRPCNNSTCFFFLLSVASTILYIRSSSRMSLWSRVFITVTALPAEPRLRPLHPPVAVGRPGVIGCPASTHREATNTDGVQLTSHEILDARDKIKNIKIPCCVEG